MLNVHTASRPSHYIMQAQHRQVRPFPAILKLVFTLCHAYVLYVKHVPSLFRLLFIVSGWTYILQYNTSDMLDIHNLTPWLW